jgi:hypothetical protein
MPFDGSGNFTRLYSWTSDRDNGIKILATRMDGEFNNFAAGMNVVFFRNGLVPMSGNLNLGQNYINNIGAGSLGALAIKFGDDPNSGIFLNGMGKPSIVANGTTRFEANTTGVAVTGALAVSGAITRDGNTVWDAGNDGAGSGLDADLLDGQNGAFYQTALGYTPVNKAGDTMTGNLTVGSNVIFVGATGNAGSIRFKDDANNVRWLNGILGVVNETNYTIYDAIGGASRMTMTPAGAVSFSSPTLTIAGQQVATLASPTLTGVPAAPTPANGTNTTQIATTAFVQSQNAATLAATLAAYAPLTSPTFTGTVTSTGTLNITNSSALQLNGARLAQPSGGVNYLFSGSSSLGILDSTGNSVRFSMTDAGAATFFGTLNAVGNLSQNGAPVATQAFVTTSYAPLANPGFTGVATYGGLEVGYRDIPRVTGGIERGKVFATGAGLTLNTGQAAGSAFSVYNDSAGAITITQGAGLTLRLAGTTTTGSRTLAARAFATIWYNSTSEAIVSGSGVS